ncbi:hypothetical protein HYV22_03595 [Candidatus Gottesmanbacteria bacterium]|nr:hypothetical protein [Candidatus Gottesmanbacteria bacterium]
MNNSSFARNLQKLSLLQVFIIVGIMLSVIYFFLYYRDQKTITTYQQESNQYIEENKQGLKLVFSTIFDKASQCINKECFHNIGLEIKKNIKINLEDFDSIYFIKLIESSGQITLGQLDMFGDFSRQTIDPTISPSVTPVVQLLSNKTKHPIFWKNSLSNYHGRGIVIPVMIDSNLLGAIVRKFPQ